MQVCCRQSPTQGPFSRLPAAWLHACLLPGYALRLKFPKITNNDKFNCKNSTVLTMVLTRWHSKDHYAPRERRARDNGGSTLALKPTGRVKIKEDKSWPAWLSG